MNVYQGREGSSAMRGLSAVFSLWLGIITLASVYPRNVYADDPPVHQLTWGIYGTGPGQFGGIGGIGLDMQGNVYVAEGNNRIQKFSNNGVFLSSFGSAGSGPGQFDEPIDVAVDALGNIYVGDFANRRIQVFSSDYTFIREWQTPSPPTVPFYVAPFAIALDPTGQFIYVRGYPQSIYVYTTDGTYITSFQHLGPDLNVGFAVGTNDFVYVGGGSTDAMYVYKRQGLTYYAYTHWGTEGTADGQFNGCGAAALDASENVWVTDGSGRVQKFTSMGIYLCQLPQGYFSGLPIDVAVDQQGNVFATDAANYRIHKFSAPPTATRTSTWGRLKALYR